MYVFRDLSAYKNVRSCVERCCVCVVFVSKVSLCHDYGVDCRDISCVLSGLWSHNVHTMCHEKQLLVLSTMPCMWVISWDGYINMINKPTRSGSQYLSDKIMTLCRYDNKSFLFIIYESKIIWNQNSNDHVTIIIL